MFGDLLRPTAPRFVTRTLVVTFATAAFALASVLVLVTLTVRDHARRAVVGRLETAHRLFATLDERRVADLRRQVATLADGPDQPALETWAAEMSALSGAGTLIVANDRILATTLPPEAVAALSPATLRTLAAGGLATLGRDEYVVRPLLLEQDTGAYLLDSIDAAARPMVRSSVQILAATATGAFLLAALAGVWLARSVSHPITRLSNSLAEMTRTRRFDRPLETSGASLEIASLTDAFNTLMASVTAADAEARSASVEAIRALVTALDARDPCTAGHSERVSALSVAIGRELRLNRTQLEVLRVGALLHDIGRIGISDHLLRKPGPLTPGEYDVIKTHPTVGARILRHVRVLEPHLAIVELHHERPDGGGYPLGLTGERIPLLARIVHVADAYDAMTSVRAYRPALSSAAALAELDRWCGMDFDPAVVRACAAVLARSDGSPTEAGASLDAFAAEPATGAVRSTAPAAPDALDEFASEAQSG